MSVESDFYREHVPSLINERLISNAFVAVGASRLDANHWTDLEINMIPVLRSNNFQSALMYSTFRPGVDIKVVGHQGGCHVELSVGRATICSVTRATMPSRVDPYSYRELLSKTSTMARSAQMPLPLESPENVPPLLFALFIFGAGHNNLRPEYCRVVFPSPDGTFAPGTIDLMTDHPEIVERFRDEEYHRNQVQAFLRQRSREAS